MERQAPKLRRHRKRDLYEVVEISFTSNVAQTANIVGLERAQGAEALEHHAGLGTDNVPAHVE